MINKNNNINYNSIREALQFQELTEEEKQRRGILARLYGPCASITDATRNGRKYSEELWEKVFNENEIVQEMFHNGGICMELDHPQDREETCSEKIAAMLPEAPKRDKDGHLICYVDLIDTPCGKIAYQLAKYGFKLGISSRGSGDLVQDMDGTESVDPDTYDFTTFDLVLLPAVKDARLSMCESLERKNFKKALTESINSASAEDKRVMEDTLRDLDIDLVKPDAPVEVASAAIPTLAEEAPDLLEDVEEPEEISNEKEAEVADATQTVKDLQDSLSDYDKKLEIEFKPIVIDDKEYPVEALEYDDSEDGKLVVSIVYSQETGNNIDSEEDFESEDAAEEKLVNDSEGVSEEAIDDGELEVLEGLKEAIRQKDALEKDVKALKSEKSVSDAKVEKLAEELNRYKTAFARTSDIAANAKKYESEVKNLTEQLNQKDTKIQKLETLKINATKLTESRDANAEKVKMLTEKLSSANKELDTAKTKLTEQATSYKKTINERTELAKKYKARFDEVLSRYIESKASMLGVRSSEIISRLNENYSIDDIDSVCDKLLTESVNVSRLPIGTGMKARINESKPMKTTTKYSVDDGYEIDDSLLELAGLK